MSVCFTRISRSITVAALLVVIGWLLWPGLQQAGSRLGKVTGVMGDVIGVNLGRLHGVRQGLRGTVFEFDENRNTVDVADVQVIAVQEENCLARVTVLRDSLRIGQFVDIEGTLPPRTLEKVNILRQMEENARNYFAAYQYTEPDSANCLSECNRILARDPENSLVPSLKNAMISNYYKWSGREKNLGRLTFALIYYTRLLKISPEDQIALENIWNCLDFMDAEAGVELGIIRKGNPPDYYYALAEQYYRRGQFDKSKKYYQFLLDNIVEPTAMAAVEALRKNDRMLKLVAKLKSQRQERVRKEQEAEQK